MVTGNVFFNLIFFTGFLHSWCLLVKIYIVKKKFEVDIVELNHFDGLIFFVFIYSIDYNAKSMPAFSSRVNP